MKSVSAATLTDPRSYRGATRAWHSPRVMTGKHNTHAVTPRFALGSEKDHGQHPEWQHLHEIRLNSRIPIYVIPARSSRRHPEKRKFHADLLARFGGSAITEEGD